MECRREALRGAAGSRVEVLLDDRDERPGSKFKDADLLGIPLRVTVGARGLKGRQSFELQERRSGERTMLPMPRPRRRLRRRYVRPGLTCRGFVSQATLLAAKVRGNSGCYDPGRSPADAYGSTCLDSARSPRPAAAGGQEIALPSLDFFLSPPGTCCSPAGQREAVTLAGLLGEISVSDLLSFFNMFRKSGILHFDPGGGHQGPLLPAGRNGFRRQHLCRRRSRRDPLSPGQGGPGHSAEGPSVRQPPRAASAKSWSRRISCGQGPLAGSPQPGGDHRLPSVHLSGQGGLSFIVEGPGGRRDRPSFHEHPEPDHGRAAPGR